MPSVPLGYEIKERKMSQKSNMSLAVEGSKPVVNTRHTHTLRETVYAHSHVKGNEDHFHTEGEIHSEYNPGCASTM